VGVSDRGPSHVASQSEAACLAECRRQPEAQWLATRGSGPATSPWPGRSQIGSVPAIPHSGCISASWSGHPEEALVVDDCAAYDDRRTALGPSRPPSFHRVTLILRSPNDRDTARRAPACGTKFAGSAPGAKQAEGPAARRPTALAVTVVSLHDERRSKPSPHQTRQALTPLTLDTHLRSPENRRPSDAPRALTEDCTGANTSRVFAR
jgi:hypothetical protein